jgi:tetratricopeptide (TPR) repeat protein
MSLSKIQYVVVFAALMLLLSLVMISQFGFTVANTKKGEEKIDKPEGLLTEEIVLSQARNSLDSSQLVWLAELDMEKARASTVSNEAEVLKLISRSWFEYRNFLVSGYYARKAAELLQTGQAWGIAGTTYGAAFSNTQIVDEKILAARQAIFSLDIAVELEPDTLQHALNRGLMYLELSTVDASVMPMKGVRILQQLDIDYPDNVMINMTLGRLSATRSGDLAKARPRFEKVLAIAEKSPVSDDILLEAHYFLIECFKSENIQEKVLFHFDKAILLSDSNQKMKEQMIIAKKKYKEKNS